MSKQANPRVVGGFVLGAVALATVAVVAFGSFEFRPDKFTCVVYFDGSVSGLNVGSPVLFRGAQIGEVTNLVVRVGQASDIGTTGVDLNIPVYVEIDRNRVQFPGREQRRPGSALPMLIKQGLRAKLVSQSMITGQLAVLLDFFPEVPVKFEHDDPAMLEIPSAPSLQEQINSLFEEIKKIPVKDTVERINHAVDGIDQLIRSDRVTGTIDALHATLDSFKNLANNVDGRIDPLAANLNSTLEAARAALQTARESISSVEGNLNTALQDADHLIKDVGGRIDPLSDTLMQALRQADESLLAAESLIAQNSPTVYRLQEALDELSAALRSIRELSDLLQQHPEAVLQGKSATGEPR